MWLIGSLYLTVEQCGCIYFFMFLQRFIVIFVNILKCLVKLIIIIITLLSFLPLSEVTDRKRLKQMNHEG